MRLRVVGTGSGKKAIQVVSKKDGKVTIHKHIGSFGDKNEEMALREEGRNWIKRTTGQTDLLDFLSSTRPQEIEINESRPLFVYQFLVALYNKIGFDRYQDSLIRDLIVARLYSPTSKREIQEILSEQFGRTYSLKSIYRHLKKGLESGLKEAFQKALVSFAKTQLNDVLKLVFYDVTTLYFESIVKSGIRDLGFSKDHRPQETQIVVGLVVNHQGFPLYFDVFNGKTFEGHTFIPVVEQIQALLENPELVVVADAAMISQDNIEKLIQKNIGFIVGGRTSSLPAAMIESISTQILGIDKKTIDLPYKNQRLICEYSAKRASKDRSDREKQLTKAQLALSNQSRLKTKLKFVKTSESSYEINTELLRKAEKLEGIKSYLTNTSLDASVVIERYHNLWAIEKAFRITKSDLKARPIFHRLDEAIQAHLIVVFAGLAISKFIEIELGWSLHKTLKLAQKMLTHSVSNPLTGETSFVKTTIRDPLLKAQLDQLIALGH